MISSWYESGFTEAVRVAANLREGEGPPLALFFAKYVLKVINLATKFTNVFHPHLRVRKCMQ